MYSLEKALDNHELIVLRVIGEWWELELTGTDKQASIRELTKALARLDMSAEIDFLGPEEAAALDELIQAGGKVPVATFERNHGKVRLMGPGRLEREEPWLDPTSPAESLWYRGFIYRGFDESEGADYAEFYYLPTEMAEQFPPPSAKPAKPKVIREPEPELEEPDEPPELPDDFEAFLNKVQKNKQSKGKPNGSPARQTPKPAPKAQAQRKPDPTPEPEPEVYDDFDEFDDYPEEDGPEVDYQKPAVEAYEDEEEYEALTMQAVRAPKVFAAAVLDAIDDMTTILALAQNFHLHTDALDWLDPYLISRNNSRRDLLVRLAIEQGLLRETNEGYRPAKPAVPWLKKEREGQLRDLVEAWSGSAWNDLCHVPELACEGSGWSNDPILGRTALLDVLPQSNDWFETADLIDYIRETDPDFQRPDGNYTTWYIRDKVSGSYLSGFDNWDLVEGRLLTFILTGPLYWLGMTEYARDEDKTIYRLTDRALAWLQNEAPPVVKERTAPIVVKDDASLVIPLTANRYHRFQATRITEPLPLEAGQPYYYQFTPHALQQAADQGIAADRLLQFLTEASGKTLPVSTKRAIERWAEKGSEAKLEQVVILRVKEADILDKLRSNARTAPYLSEFLGDLVVIVRPGDWPRLQQAAAQLGLLLETLEFADEG